MPDPPRLRGRQVAQYPHPTLPALRAQLSIPALRFFFSAARVQRLMRVLRSALPGAPACGGRAGGACMAAVHRAKALRLALARHRAEGV